MEYKTILFERRGDLAILRLNRPERLNAISFEMLDELLDVLDRLRDDLATRVVLIRGQGRAFCAGTDLKGLAAADGRNSGLGEVQERYHKRQQPFSDLARKMRQIPQPLIAAVHGPAAGGGFSIALACDLRIAADTARFNAAFIKIGFSGGDCAASYFLPRLIGLSRATEYLMTGRFMDAATALRFGLVSRIVPEDELESAALELAAEILQNSPFGVRMTKELLNMNVDAPGLDSAIHMENRTQVLCGLTEDMHEGAQAFLEKRRPQWQDR